MVIKSAGVNSIKNSVIIIDAYKHMTAVSVGFFLLQWRIIFFLTVISFYSNIIII